MNLHQELVKRSLPFIEDYQKDLLVHDKNHLDKFPDRPFLHFTGSTGTHIITLFFLEDYPKKYEQVPYLFGKADRDHILNELTSVVECMNRCNRMDLILYFDGKKLNEISYETAKLKVAEYTRKMKQTFIYH